MYRYRNNLYPLADLARLGGLNVISIKTFLNWYANVEKLDYNLLGVWTAT